MTETSVRPFMGRRHLYLCQEVHEIEFDPIRPDLCQGYGILCITEARAGGPGGHSLKLAGGMRLVDR